MAFVHLHCHTEWSLLDGSNKVSEYVKQVSALGMSAAAITDHGVMYGVIDFYNAAREAGIKPILGCEVYVAPGSRFDRELSGSDDRYYHLILLAENDRGYANLSKIVSRSFTEGYYYRPRVDMELLREFHEGIIASSACLAGEVARDIVRGDIPAAEEAARKYNDCFGQNNFFLELQDHGYADQKTVNRALLKMSEKLGIPLIATNDCHYTYADDAEAHDMLLCIQTGKKVADEDRMRYPGGQFYVKSEEEMRSLFPYAQEALDNTAKIADRCNVTIEFGNTRLPHFDVPEGYDSWTYLNKLCSEGLAERYPDDDGAVRSRLDYELGVIRKMGYVDYFLIVWDYVNFCRENGIAVGPGRGSAAGSIVSYCLHITSLDPIRYGLIFERFLNPERVSMPDIDVDFDVDRRQEVIDYVTRKYGRERVVQIITFGTMAAKGVIRDVGRVMDLPYSFVDGISKMIPNELNITLDKALKMNPELRAAVDGDPRVKTLMDMSMRLEGLPRHTSVHAAGVVICSEPAEDLVPLARAQDGSTTTQFTMTTIEHLGLLKMDFLGLRTLNVIHDAVLLANRTLKERAAENGGAEPAQIDIDNIDFNDRAVFASISTGHTEGVFQLESGGMQSFMKELRPGSLEDIIAGIALYRPGPMDFIPQYIERKNSRVAITYATPLLEPILAPTYGCIVYQEQVMQIVQQLAGYTLGRSDLVRRAMSKKKQDVMEAERRNFIYGNEAEGVKGCVANGIPAETASGIYDTMLDFAKYAFNKSHSACYAVITYQTAWLKYYFPTEFMAALMTTVVDFPGKLAGYILTSRTMGIRLLPPDINEGEAGFSVSGGAVRYALTAIKGVGRGVIDGIVQNREQYGKFRDLYDFLERVTAAEIDANKRVIENFIKAGAFDSFGSTRKQQMSVFSQILDGLQASKKNDLAGQMSLFDLAPETDRTAYTVPMPDVGEYTREMKLAFEKEVLGVYVSGHPLDDSIDFWKSRITRKAADFMLDEETGTAAVTDGAVETIGGLVAARKIKYTKNDKVMAFVTIEDLTGDVEVIVFPRDYEQYSSVLAEDSKVFVTGRVSLEEDKDGKLVCQSITPFDRVPKKLWLRFDTRESYAAAEKELAAIIDTHGGPDEVSIYIASPKSMKTMPRGSGVRADAELLALLKDRYGADNVILK
ncbi:MAG: DNA polymerase III subunit alpha [Lachnospiraceae bacterium]|jgi:DNA polymerase-3 subunit alpha|nr:DNA polymerase III subunit alpha [Lachnospiraceae bacterium]